MSAYPPGGVLPFQGLAAYAAPLLYVYACPAAAYKVHRGGPPFVCPLASDHRLVDRQVSGHATTVIGEGREGLPAATTACTIACLSPVRSLTHPCTVDSNCPN